ncbi:hypothetical protein AVEN_225454-1, partial [Araneus ventricosus]
CASFGARIAQDQGLARHCIGGHTRASQEGWSWGTFGLSHALHSHSAGQPSQAGGPALRIRDVSGQSEGAAVSRGHSRSDPSHPGSDLQVEYVARAGQTTPSHHRVLGVALQVSF